MTIINNLESAQQYIDAALHDLKETPEKDALNSLLNACENIDTYYKETFCASCDSEYGDEKEGYTYENGISLEFYIEASWWHDVSKAIRLLRPNKDENND